MTKITLRTKIALTIVGLLTITGIFYAANPVQFASVPSPNGVAASKNDLIVTEYCSQNIDKIDSFGNVSLLATIPGFSSCREKYLTIAPAQSHNAGFTPRDIFVTQGADVYKIHETTVTPFTTIPGCAADHTGITFDHFGSFGYNMILTCQHGGVWQVDSMGTPTQIADLSTGTDLMGSTNFDHPNTNLEFLEIEGPAVVPLNFGPHSGEILVADEDNGQVHAIAKGATDDPSGGKVTYRVFDMPGAEAVIVIPKDPCAFSSGGSFFQVIQDLGKIYQYQMTDFTSLGGSILLTSEFGQGTYLVTFDETNSIYNTPVIFNNTVAGNFEGSSWADCDVPPPTPTPTAIATATSTPTPTPTPTASPTPCTLSACTAAYPFVSNNPQTNVAFNESEVMRGFRISTSTDGCSPKSIQVFYNDEHALTLGVRQVSVKSGSGMGAATAATTYEVSDLSTSTNPATPTPPPPGPKPPKNPPANPGSATNPDVGASVAQGGTDTAGRPMFPALFITDLSVGAGASNALAGDWQYGGTGVPPTAVFGTWKAAVKTTDCSKNPCTTTVTPDADPAKNNWNLGLGSDPVPAGLTNEGYGAEVRWDVPALGLISGHQYRLYFMVHDGDQNKTGGDVGQACGIFVMP